MDVLKYTRCLYLHASDVGDHFHNSIAIVMAIKKEKIKKPSKAELEQQVRMLQQVIQTTGADSVKPILEVKPLGESATSISYTNNMVLVLMELRFTHFKEAFQRNNSVQQLSVLWEKLLVKFNIVNDTCVPNVTSLKNKLNSLRTQYTTIRKEEQERTGNSTEDPISYPEYWAEMVTFFGDKKGLGDIEFGSEEPCLGSSANNTEEIIDAEEDEVVTKKRKLEIQSEIERQRNSRNTTPKKNNLNDGLAALGSTLAKGLVDAAAMSNGNNQSSVEIFNILAQTKDSMDKSNLIQKRIEENLDKANSIQERATEVQSQMLQFLQSKLG